MKRTRLDLNQLAHSIVAQASGDEPKVKPPKKKSEAAVARSNRNPTKK